MRWTVLLSVLPLAACVGQAHMPGDPGGALSDISSLETREAWLASHPETDPAIADSIRQGVFATGMTVAERDALTNQDRRGTTGNGYWRANASGDEVRYRWFVASERVPFKDGRDRLVCELVYAHDLLVDVRFCTGAQGGGPSGGG